MAFLPDRQLLSSLTRGYQELPQDEMPTLARIDCGSCYRVLRFDRAAAIKIGGDREAAIPPPAFSP
jgi:hypothetical protein